MPRSELWPMQSKVHNFMLAYQRRHGRPPSSREIARVLGLKSTAGAYQHVLALLRRGAVVATQRGTKQASYTAVPYA